MIHPSGASPPDGAPRSSSTTIRSVAAAVPRDSVSHANVTPLGRHTASASSRSRRTSDGETALVNVSVMGSGGGARCTGAVPQTSATNAMAISILSAIDGAGREKFDVRNREERTVCEFRSDAVQISKLIRFSAQSPRTSRRDRFASVLPRATAASAGFGSHRSRDGAGATRRWHRRRPWDDRRALSR